MDQEKIKEMREIIKIQGSPGNYDTSEYMLGMYNGMELMLSIAEEREPQYKDKTFLAGDRQVKGVPLDLQLFTDNEPEIDILAREYAMSGIQKTYNDDPLIETRKELGKVIHEKEQLERERELWKKITFLLCDDTLNSQKMDR